MQRQNNLWVWLTKPDLKISSEALYALQKEQTMSNTKLMKVLIHALVECVVRQVKQLVIS